MTDFIVFVFFGCVVNMVNLFFLAMSVWGGPAERCCTKLDEAVK